MKTYSLADQPTHAELETHGANRLTVYAVATGEMRPPKAGEWYLSGAIPAAYRASKDFTTAYQIVTLRGHK